LRRRNGRARERAGDTRFPRAPNLQPHAGRTMDNGKW